MIFQASMWVAVALLFGVVLILGVPVLRRALITRAVFGIYKRALPKMSDTERSALEAGTVWWEGELFRGNPDWNKLLAYPVPTLSQEEQSFLDNEVEELCALVNDWKVSTELFDLPPEAWQYMKEKGFFGMIVPRKYGGREFSAFAHSQIVTKLSTRSSALSVTVMVPNSLGPAELLLHYGTEAQKDYYLPRLAKGEDIPAFALTSPWAGSDAASIPDYGIVCKGQWQGREILGMRVSWEKRYITLGPVCTLLGLAFRLHDPDGLLGSAKDIGITCALIPRNTPGMQIGNRHFPLNAMFMNGPTRGKDVFMPLDYIIGGPGMAGKGWRMLMDCLAAGRAISLPSCNAGMAQLTGRAVGGYARIRSQFRTAVGRFEGVEEALARIGGNTYMIDAVRKFTAGAVDLGEKPAVASAIAKYHVTERARQVVNDGMDVIGGKGICLGPSNFLGRAYQQIPIGITVEGANILTRSMILFGQGAIRCHPYLLSEMQAAREPDAAKGLIEFDRAIFGHIKFVLQKGVSILLHGLSGSRLASVPTHAAPETHRYYRQLTRYSTALAFLSDISMLLLGGGLKRREKISARLGDVLSLLYLCSATLKRYESEGRQQADMALVHWSVQDAIYRMQAACVGVIENFPNRIIGGMLNWIVFPWGRRSRLPDDSLGHRIAELLIEPSTTRDRLTAETFIPDGDSEPLSAIENALRATIKAEEVEARIRKAEKEGVFCDMPDANVRDYARAAFRMSVVTKEEFSMLEQRNRLRDVVIGVDEFPFDLGGNETRAAC